MLGSHNEKKKPCNKTKKYPPLGREGPNLTSSNYHWNDVFKREIWPYEILVDFHTLQQIPNPLKWFITWHLVPYLQYLSLPACHTKTHVYEFMHVGTCTHTHIHKHKLGKALALSSSYTVKSTALWTHHTLTCALR